MAQNVSTEGPRCIETVYIGINIFWEQSTPREKILNGKELTFMQFLRMKPILGERRGVEEIGDIKMIRNILISQRSRILF